MSKRLTLLNGRIADQKVDETGRTVAAHVLGTLAVDDVGNYYRYVQNGAVNALLQYDAVTYLNADTSDFVVTSVGAAGTVWRPAGVYGEAVGIPVDTYFWLQVSGQATINTAGGAPTPGVPVAADAANDGEAIDGQVAAATDFAEHMGLFLDAGTPTATVLLRGLV